MACKLNPLFYVLIVLGSILVRILAVVGQPQVPCYFIFGDSFVDSGNNNGLRTTAKANYPPYGIDFPLGITGRSTNGRTYADIIGQLLGFSNFIPSYANVTNQEISIGVNYASAGAGIRGESGRTLGERISLIRQIINHKAVISRLLRIQRNVTFTNDYLQKCIYLVNIGRTDYIDNYFMPKDYPTSRIYNTDRYAQVLVRQYSLQLKTLYKLGARKVAVNGLLIGCTPYERAKFGTPGQICVDSITNAAKLFNDRLKPLVDEINNDNSDARFTFINLTSIAMPLGGVALLAPPCCQVRGDGQCVPNSTPCPNRNLAIFYDGFNPTENTTSFLARRSYNALSPMDASPFDIRRLAQL